MNYRTNWTLRLWVAKPLDRNANGSSDFYGRRRVKYGRRGLRAILLLFVVLLSMTTACLYLALCALDAEIDN